MANLTQGLINGRRLNIVHLDASIDVGYTSFTGPEGMRISIRAKDRENPKERDYGLELDRISVGKVVDRLLNPAYNMGYFAAMSPRPSERSDFHYEDLLLEHGIKVDSYRYPAPPFANGTKRWFWVRAVNRYHAEHQFARLIKDFHPALVQLHEEEE